MDVADETLPPGIAPGPAETVVEHLEPVAGRQLSDCVGILGRPRSKGCAGGDRPLDRLGIMRCDHAPRERDVGEILAIGVMGWVGPFRRAGEREFVSVDARRLGPAR